MKKQKTIPYDFVLERLESLNPITRPMFGCHAIYVKDKIIGVLRKKGVEDPDNGMWIATTPQHHASLKSEFPSLRSIKVLGGNGSSWQILPEDADDFEESVFNACDLILRGDSRIGKVPSPKRKKKKD